MTRIPLCPDCGVEVGALHCSGCDVERCPRCGRQAISCSCIYEICGLDPATLATAHPDIFRNGPTDAMVDRWDVEWGARAIPWSGAWPGEEECREYGWYAKFTASGWLQCDAKSRCGG